MHSLKNSIRLFLTISFLIISCLAFSQEQVEDSLRQTLDDAITVEARFNILIDLSQYSMRYSLEKSKEYLHQATVIANNQSNEEWLASINIILGRIEATTGNYDLALTLFEDALVVHKKMENIPQIISCINGLGIINRRKGNFLEAVKILESAKLYFDSDEISDVTKGSILNNLSNAYSQINLYSKAINAIFESLKYREKADDNRGLGHSYGNLGLIYYEQKKYDVAIENYKKSLEILKEENDLIGQMNALTNLSAIYTEMNDFEKELELRNKELELALQLGAKERTWSAQMGLANYYVRVNKFDKAEAIFESLEIQEVQENLRYLYSYYSYYSSLFFEKKQYQKAVEYGEKALKLAQEMGDNKQMAGVLSHLHYTYLKNNQPKKAYQYLLEYQAVNDSLMNNSNIEALTTQKLQFEFEKEQEVLQLEKDALENEVRIQRLMRWALLGLLIFIGSIVVLGYRYYKKENTLLALDLENKKVIEAQAKELQKYNEELRKLDETKTQFFSNISHEFKTPLTLIINPISRLLQSHSLNEEGRFLAKSVEQNSLQLLDLTNQVLELTKFEVSKVTIHPIVFNLKQAMGKLYADFESLATSKEIQFVKQIEINVSLNIELDYNKVITIIKNLISNAIKFTSEGGQIFFKVFERAQHIEIHVEDTGRGIHASDLPHIFGRYYQAKIGNRIQEGGTGIGLAISAEYAKLLKGNLTVQSEYGQGSNFVLNIPKIVATDDAVSNQLFNKKSISKETITPFVKDNHPDTQLPTILIVEDNLDMQNYLQLVLKDYYHLEIASHGKAALSILEKKYQAIQLIISDVMMPEMNGYELLEKLKKSKHYASIPTIMLTALSGTDDKLKALRVGIDDYLTKPFVDEELMIRIDNLIQNQEERKAYIINNANSTTEIETLKTEQPIFNQIDLEWLEKLEFYVNKNLRYSLTVDTLAQHLNVSRRTLYNKLKILTGLTPNQYVNEIRFQAARKIIEENNNWTVKAIALKVGFKDEKNFSRNFKKRFGKYPSAYLE